jgi:hypothetical protein
MNTIASIIIYVENLRLFTQPWTVVAIFLTTIVAYSTLLYHLGDCLKTINTKLTPAISRKKIDSLTVSKEALLSMAQFSFIALLFLLGRSLMVCSDSPDVISLCSLMTFFVTLFCPISIGLLALASLAVEGFIFDFKRQEAEIECISIDAVVYLKCGNKIKGSFRDLGLLKGKRYVPFMLEDKSVVTIDSTDIAAVFLQSVYGRNKTLRDGLFKDGPKTLQLKYPHKEVFHNTKYFLKNGLTVLKIAKPTTRSRYAILNADCIQM